MLFDVSIVLFAGYRHEGRPKGAEVLRLDVKTFSSVRLKFITHLFTMCRTLGLLKLG